MYRKKSPDKNMQLYKDFRASAHIFPEAVKT